MVGPLGGFTDRGESKWCLSARSRRTSFALAPLATVTAHRASAGLIRARRAAGRAWLGLIARKLLTPMVRRVTLDGMKKIVVTVVTCKRCGKEWVPRKPEWPRRCPACRSPYWDRPRRGAGE